VRSLGHEHDGLETQMMGLVEEVIERQSDLSGPDAGIADGV